MIPMPRVYRCYAIVSYASLAFVVFVPLLWLAFPRLSPSGIDFLLFMLVGHLVINPSVLVGNMLLRQRVVLNRGYVCPETGMVLRKLGIPESVRRSNYFEEWRFLFRRRAGQRPVRRQGRRARRLAALVRTGPMQALLNIQRRRYGYPLSGGVLKREAGAAGRGRRADGVAGAG